MHRFVIINALICINNYIITCINSMLSRLKRGLWPLGERRERGKRPENNNGASSTTVAIETAAASQNGGGGDGGGHGQNQHQWQLP